MTEFNHDTVMEVVQYVLENHNITDAAVHFQTSRNKIYSILDMVRIEGHPYYNEAIAKELEKSLLQSKLDARSKAGSISHRPRSLNDDDVISVIYSILFEGSNTRMLGEKYGCSCMTISNAIKNLKCPKMKEIIGDARAIYSRYRLNPLYPRIIFCWLFSPSTLSSIQDEKALDILYNLYEKSIAEFGFEMEGYGETWKR